MRTVATVAVVWVGGALAAGGAWWALVEVVRLLVWRSMRRQLAAEVEAELEKAASK